MRLQLLALFLMLVIQLPSQAQQNSPAQNNDSGSPGESIIPAGKYWLTNVDTGRSTLLIVSSTGDVFVQEAPAVQPSVPPQQPQSKYGVMPGLLNRQGAPFQQYGAGGNSGVYAQQPYVNQQQPQPPAYQPAGQQAYGQQPYGQLPQAPYGQPPSPVFGLPPGQAGY